MKHLLFAAAVASTLGVATPGRAADNDAIVVSKAVELLNALNYVTGGRERVVGEGAGQKVVWSPFDLGETQARAGDVRWALADDIAILKKFVTTAQGIQRQLTDAAEAKANQHPLKPVPARQDEKGNVIEPEHQSEAQIDLQKQIQDLLDSERPIEKLNKIKRADLKAGENQFPSAVLEALRPVVEK